MRNPVALLRLRSAVRGLAAVLLAIGATAGLAALNQSAFVAPTAAAAPSQLPPPAFFMPQDVRAAAPPTATRTPAAPTVMPLFAPQAPAPLTGQTSEPIAAPASAPDARPFPTVAWMRTTRETGLWSSAEPDAEEFTKIPTDTLVRVLERREGRTHVHYGGDAKTRKAGEVWIETAALTAAGWPRWARVRRATELRVESDAAAPSLAALQAGAYVETIGEPTGRWAKVFFLGDGRAADPFEGWVDAADFGVPAVTQESLAKLSIGRAVLAEGRPEIWVRVPYRSQLDGTAYASANCGPASVAMALEAFGKTEAPSAVRAAALALQGMPDCDDCGLFIQHLATVAEASGVPTHGLRGAEDSFRRWSVDDVRTALRAGQVVIPQVKYRRLPGRGSSGFGGDHYVVLTGIRGDQFVYNDPMDHDGSGYGRLISAEALATAMADSSFPRVAFAVGR